MKQHMQPQPALLLGTSIATRKPLILTGPEFERHKWIMGISGSGKSTFLAWIALSLLRQGISFSVIDPHGDLARLMLSLLISSGFFANEKAYQRLWFVDFARTDAAMPFNILKQPFDSHTIASNVLEAMHRAFPVSGTTANLDNTLLASFYALAEKRLPVTQLQRLLVDAPFRSQVVSGLADPLVAQFFAAKLAEKASSQLIDSAMRRAFLLTFSPPLRASLGHSDNRLSFRHLMDHQVSCLFSLGGLDDQSKRLLGCLLMVGLEQAFLSRASISPEQRAPYHVIVDEFPLFSASGDSFSVILEQVRKYKGTLYLAHQSLSQLSRDMTGSIQNALAILMQSGRDDSSTLVNQFYRPIPHEEPGLLRSLFGSKPTSPFVEAETSQQARSVFENLARQEAIVTIGQNQERIMTPTIPIQGTSEQLRSVEAMYAKRLLVPITSQQIAAPLQPLPAQIQPVPMHTTPAPAPAITATRRVQTPGNMNRPAFSFATGSLTTDILHCLYHFHYATLQQCCQLLDKETSVNYLREKVKTLITDGLVASITLARPTVGKPPTVIFLTAKGHTSIAKKLDITNPIPLQSGQRQHAFLEHTLAVNHILIAAAKLPMSQPAMSLLDLKHERTLKTSPIILAPDRLLVPDGFLLFRAQPPYGVGDDIGICIEVDRNTEDREKIQEKLTSYVTVAVGPYQQAFGVNSLAVAFVVTEGGEQRVNKLLTWAVQVLPTNRELFLFGAVKPAPIALEQLFLDRVFAVPGDSSLYALVEKRL